MPVSWEVGDDTDNTDRHGVVSTPRTFMGLFPDPSLWSKGPRRPYSHPDRLCPFPDRLVYKILVRDDLEFPKS